MKTKIFCTYFVDILQVLTEIQKHFRCWNEYRIGNKQVLQIGYSLILIGYACTSTDKATTLMSVHIQVPEAFKSRPTAILAGNACTCVQDVHAESTADIPPLD